MKRRSLRALIASGDLDAPLPPPAEAQIDRDLEMLGPLTEQLTGLVEAFARAHPGRDDGIYVGVVIFAARLLMNGAAMTADDFGAFAGECAKPVEAEIARLRAKEPS